MEALCSVLQAGVARGEYNFLQVAGAYFDDKEHFMALKSLCSFSHPKVANGRNFGSMKALLQQLKREHNAQFCSICLEGRKVFISEQIMYKKDKLDKHMRSGDDQGPMSSSSGFKGHPECRFCRRRFYGENEIFQHMHSAHEECYICKRMDPHRHVYYRDYSEMEGTPYM